MQTYNKYSCLNIDAVKMLHKEVASPRRQLLLPFKQRIIIQRKQKHTHTDQAQTNRPDELTHFDPKAELKAKILKAILASGDTIEKEIDYKKSMIRCMTPNQANKSIKHFQINLSLRNKNTG